MNTSAFSDGMKELFRLASLPRNAKDRISEEEFTLRATALQQASIPASVERLPVVSKSTRPKPILSDGNMTVDMLPPAADMTVVSQHASSLYTPVSTREVVRVGEEFGFHWIRWEEQARNERVLLDGSKARVRDPLTTPHMVTLRRQQDVGLLDVGQTIVQAIVTNSSDLSTPLKVSLGFFECICTNQAISQRSGFSVRMKHVKLVLADIKRSMQSLFANTDVMLAQSEVLKNVILTQPQAIEFAGRAIPLRWNEVNDNGDVVVAKNAPRPDQLLAVRYQQQAETTLYNVYQNVQRNLLDGGFTIPSTSKSGTRLAKKITGLKQVVALNTSLDELLADYATELGAILPEPSKVYEPNYTVLQDGVQVIA